MPALSGDQTVPGTPVGGAGTPRRVVRRVALLNLGCFGIGFAVTLAIGSAPKPSRP